ncbi:MAG: deoxyribodipyrimidine photo-lyase [Gammaproteobacteria bacterium]|jgi:deoxyribodipyrimidine photo-lyase
MKTTPIIYWLRRDFRLSDHPGLTAAVLSGRPVIPVFIYDELVESYGAAPKWRLGLAVEHFAKSLVKMGSKLILRRGRALNVLRDLAEETGAGAVYWSRAYDPAAIIRDTHVKTGLKADGLEAKSHPGHLLFEPWKIETKTGGYYKVFTPMWKAVRNIVLEQELPEITHLPEPLVWPRSDDLDSWHMGLGMKRGAKIVAKRVCVGEKAANERLAIFIQNKVENYKTTRDVLSVDGTSRLSENLTYGEISPRAVWHAGWKTLNDGVSDAEVFLKELVWREFAYHLAYYTPAIVSENWKDAWNSFPWKDDGIHALPWKQGRTGIQLVDAAMREMYVTGTMHNRGRMIVASYLTKHMMTHWKVGQKWFEDCLIDWDPASNAMGWQWAAGSGPDAAPFFRIFNPDTQAEKFDKDRNYRARYLAECFSDHTDHAQQFFEAIPQSWKLSASDAYPAPIVELDVGRRLALLAYKGR